MVRDVAFLMIITDVDFYVDLSDMCMVNSRYNGLGAGSSDTYGEGYDVQTSAKVMFLAMKLINVFIMMENIQTLLIQDDIIDTTLQGQWKMVDGATSNGANWAAASCSK